MRFQNQLFTCLLSVPWRNLSGSLIRTDNVSFGSGLELVEWLVSPPAILRNGDEGEEWTRFGAVVCDQIW